MSKFVYVAYFALGPIYWLPGIGTAPFQVLKLSLFALLMSRIIATWSRKLRFSLFRESLIYFIPLVITVSFSVISLGGVEADIMVAANILLPMAVMCIVPALPESEKNAIFHGIRKSSIYFSLVAVFVPLGVLFPEFNWPNPFSESTNDLFIGQTYTGFGGSRTGWSQGAVLIFAVALGNFALAENRMQKWLALGSVLIIAISILIPAGRGGIFAIQLMLLVMLFLGGFGKKNRGNIFIILLITLALMATVTIFSEDLRLNLLLSGQVSEGASGRFEGYVIALNLLSENFLFGVGVRGSDLGLYGLDYPMVHNAILNFASMFGFVPLAASLVLFGWIIIRIYERRKYAFSSLITMYAALTMTGIGVVTFTEPIAAFGTFHNVIIYWFIIALFVGTSARTIACHSVAKQA